MPSGERRGPRGGRVGPKRIPQVDASERGPASSRQPLDPIRGLGGKARHSREVARVQNSHTRKLDRSQVSQGLFLARNRVTLVVVEGPGAGNEHLLERSGMKLGRGPDVDIVIQDDSMSREHVAFDAGADGFRVRDLGSTNGMTVNGSRVAAADLKHGDRISLGEHTFQFVIEKRERVGTYDLSDGS
jgi:hypothetical protein